VRWVYDYTEEQRQLGYEVIEKALMRPTVRVQLVNGDQQTQRLVALVDSGCDHVLAPLWLAHTIGVEPDEDRRFMVKIAGRDREVRLADIDLRLVPPDDRADEPPVEWQATVGFFTYWTDPPWLVLLGQLGFFDQFTVVMSRLAQRLAILDRDHFDIEFPTSAAGETAGTPPRFDP
jgi:hypothetical protein